MRTLECAARGRNVLRTGWGRGAEADFNQPINVLRGNLKMKRHGGLTGTLRD